MRVRYDLHIHSGLSPCAEKDMTPATIAGYAKLGGLDMIAVSDHNAVANVPAAMRAGREYGIEVVPAMELQTDEDVHILCLFPDFAGLMGFYESLAFQQVKNRPEIFGRQLIFDEDDNVTGEEERLLLASALISSERVPARCERFGGVAVPAHIDREANGMIQILGAVPDCFSAVELSALASENELERYRRRFRVLRDSDAHRLADISFDSEIELPRADAGSLIAWLKGES